jgi:hypothetical protein
MGKKVFTLNEQVVLNKRGLIKVYKDDEDFYSVQFDHDKGDFTSEELDFFTPTPSEPKKEFDYEGKALAVAQLVAEKQMAYGNSVDTSFDVIRAFLGRYKTEDGHYKISETLLRHLLLQVRMIDKQNRIFTNPEGDLMGESPYTDMLGYSLLGKKMMEHDKK